MKVVLRRCSTATGAPGCLASEPEKPSAKRFTLAPEEAAAIVEEARPASTPRRRFRLYRGRDGAQAGAPSTERAKARCSVRAATAEGRADPA